MQLDDAMCGILEVYSVGGTIKPSKKKILAVAQFLHNLPKSTKSVQNFLGLTGYFRNVVPQYALAERRSEICIRN